MGISERPRRRDGSPAIGHDSLDPVTSAQRRFERLLDNAQDMVYRTVLVPQRRVEFVSGAALAITGHAPSEFYADPDLPWKSVHPDDVHHMAQPGGDPDRLAATVTMRWVHPDGKIVWAEHRRVPVIDGSGRLVAVEGIARDLTERVETQQRLRDSEQQLRQLAARVESAREEERTSLARELHDELGQTLTALKLELGRAVDVLRSEQLSTAAVNRLQSLVALTEVGILTVRRLATSLRPPTLDHLGLPGTINWEAATFQARTGLRCHVRTHKDSTQLGPEQQTVLFRILQEALTNVVRHARASAVQVTLVERAGVAELRIRDNGVGITADQAADPRAIGLLNMRERAALIGGTFQVEGRRGKGTTISVRVPFERRSTRRGGATANQRPR